MTGEPTDDAVDEAVAHRGQQRDGPRHHLSKRLCALLFAGFAAAQPARAQDDAQNELWSEVDVYAGLSPSSRLFFLASVTRAEEVDYREASVGAHVDFFLKPILRPGLRHTPDVDKRRYLSFRLGYRYAQALGEDADSYREHRPLAEATGRVYLPGNVVFLNRSRFDARRVNGEWSWRYRNRSRIEREIPAWSRALNPYVMVEFYYDSRHDAWIRERYFAGMEWPLGRKAALDTYFVRQDDSRSSPAHVNAFGVALNLFY